jgi:pyruvate/2-oxoglutarate dehydrogenase complex dihydrolipoamide dehydrogenase (E3) component
MKRRVAVVGAGPAGLTAARAAADAEAEVILIGAELPGGRANWHSLLPSKVFLTATDLLGAVDRLADLGIESPGGRRADIRQLTRRVQALSRARSEAQASDLVSRGVRLVTGTARFRDPNTLRIDSGDRAPEEIEADAVILATGSVPIFPPDLKPNGREILAPRFVGKLERLPASMILVGGGVTGTEFAYAFSRLGVQVTWLVDEFGVLPTFDGEAVEVLLDELRRGGMTLHAGVGAASVTTRNGVTVTLRDGTRLQAESAFVAIGRRPDLDGLSLEAAGLQPGPVRGVAVDSACRSRVPHIYAAGDITGPPMCANKAMAQGWVAGLHAAGGKVKGYRPDSIIEAVYTDPQVAQVGLGEAAAAKRGTAVRVLKSAYGASLKGALSEERAGFVKLIADADSN